MDVLMSITITRGLSTACTPGWFKLTFATNTILRVEHIDIGVDVNAILLGSGDVVFATTSVPREEFAAFSSLIGVNRTVGQGLTGACESSELTAKVATPLDSTADSESQHYKEYTYTFNDKGPGTRANTRLLTSRSEFYVVDDDRSAGPPHGKLYALDTARTPLSLSAIESLWPAAVASSQYFAPDKDFEFKGCSKLVVDDGTEKDYYEYYEDHALRNHHGRRAYFNRPPHSTPVGAGRQLEYVYKGSNSLLVDKWRIVNTSDPDRTLFETSGAGDVVHPERVSWLAGPGHPPTTITVKCDGTLGNTRLPKIAPEVHAPGSRVKFKGTGASPLVVELVIDGAQYNTLEWIWSSKLLPPHTTSPALALQCAVRVLDEQNAIPKGSIRNEFPTTAFTYLLDQDKPNTPLGATVRVQIEISGVCEVILEDIKFSKKATDGFGQTTTSIDSVGVTFTGELQTTFGAITAAAKMDKFGLAVDFTGRAAELTRVGVLNGRIEGDLGQFAGDLFTTLVPTEATFSLSDLNMAVAFQQLGASDFTFFYDMDVTRIGPIIQDIANELKGLNIGLPEFIPGTRASTMPIPRVFDFSSVLTDMAGAVASYLEVGNITTHDSVALGAQKRYPTLVGLAANAGTVLSDDFYKITASIQKDEASASLQLKIDLLMKVDYHTSFKDGSGQSNALETVCNSLFDQITAKHGSLFNNFFNTSQLGTGAGCGTIIVDATGVLGASVGVPLKGALALALANNSSSPDTGATQDDDRATSFIETAQFSIHPDTTLEVDLVARPDTPLLDADIRVHFLASVGKQRAAPLQLKDLRNRTKLQRTFRAYNFQQLYGHLDAAFKPKMKASSLLHGMGYPDSLPQLQPVLVLSSRDLFAKGFGLNAMMDVAFDLGVDSGGSLDGHTANVMGEITALLKSVTGLGLGTALPEESPSLFEPLGNASGGLGVQAAEKLGNVTQSFIALWRKITAYRAESERRFIKLRALQDLQKKVMKGLHDLIMQITGIDDEHSSTADHLLALAFDMFGMLLPDGTVPGVAAVSKFNPYATTPVDSTPLGALSQFFLGERATPGLSVQGRILQLLDKILPRQLTLRSVLTFCTKHLKAMFSRLTASSSPNGRRSFDHLKSWVSYHTGLLNAEAVTSKSAEAFGGALVAAFDFGVTVSANAVTGNLVVDMYVPCYADALSC